MKYERFERFRQSRNFGEDVADFSQLNSPSLCIDHLS